MIRLFQRIVCLAILTMAALVASGCQSPDPPPAGGSPFLDAPPNINQAAPLTGEPI